MLNGKFYTGLTAQMIDRNVPNKNRLESHFFWPDDTKTESAVETRVRRRASLQLLPSEKPHVQKRISVDDRDMSTRKLFQNEFTKSSIQFCDNIAEEEPMAVEPRRRPVLRVGKPMKHDITPKPTATVLELPEQTVTEGYTSAKKKQAFTSKIQFYDYVNEDMQNRNNIRRPKLDMNDKREVERNSKNSPKLQVKRNARNLQREAELERRNNIYRREEFTPERNFENDFENAIPVKPPRRPRNIEMFEKRGYVVEMSNAQRPPARGGREVLRKPSVDDDYYAAYENTRANRRNYEDDHYDNRRRARSIEHETEQLPKKILKNPIRAERETFNEYRNDGRYDDDVDFIEQNMRNVRVRTSPKKHVTYNDEVYEREDTTASRRNDDDYYEPELVQQQSAADDYEVEEVGDSHESRIELDRIVRHYNNKNNNNAAAAANGGKIKTGSQKQQQQQQQLRQQNNYANMELADNNANMTDQMYDDDDQFMETCSSENNTRAGVGGNSATTTATTMRKSLNINYNNNNNANNYNKNINNNNKMFNQATLKIKPTKTTTTTTTTTTSRKIIPKMPDEMTSTSTARANNRRVNEAIEPTTITPRTTTTRPTKLSRTASAAAVAAAAAAQAAASKSIDGKKHLRSNLCFNNGEIVANNVAPASAAQKAPTHRNARSSSATQRINVGLPD